MHYVYVLQCENDETKYYVGYSSDLRRRLKEHNASQNDSTRGRQWKLIYYEAYLSEKIARKREKLLKNDGRANQILMKRIKEQFESD